MDVPVAIEGRLYIKCNSESEEDLEKAKFKIMRVMEHRRYIIKTQKLKENKSRTSSMIILTLAIELFAALFVVLLIKDPSFNIGYLDDEGIITLLLGLITVTLSITTLFTSYLSIMKRRWQEYMEKAEDIRHTIGNKEIYQQRKETIERLFGTAKEQHGFRYTQYIGKARMEMKAGLTFACMNLKKLAKILEIRESKMKESRSFLRFLLKQRLFTEKWGCRTNLEIVKTTAPTLSTV